MSIVKSGQYEIDMCFAIEGNKVTTSLMITDTNPIVVDPIAIDPKHVKLSSSLNHQYGYQKSRCLANLQTDPSIRTIAPLAWTSSEHQKQ